ncbi:hypothetical protein [Mycobacterium sp. 94-17]|nr:hypothetical protein [Mycobacterium sp. 94-17]MEB4211128.1 hypothetical protein [Mycobacterium sp. 94-17]
MSASKKKILKTAAVIAMLTGVMLGSSGCVVAQGVTGGGAPPVTAF